MRCPSNEELLAFHLGELADEQIVSVGEHLASCARCEQQARQLDDLSDQALSALRRCDTEAVPASTRAPGQAAAVTLSAALPDISGYDILGLIGRGGMGLVYKARHRRLDRLVALKCLRADTAPDLERFQAEAQAVAHLSHPNIVQIFEVGEWQGRLFLTLEFLGGGTLAEHLTGKPQDARAAAGLAQTVARAVHYAHTRGIVHRDLKPANILLQTTPETRNPKSDTSLNGQRTVSDTAVNSLPDALNASFGVGEKGEFRLADCQPKITDFGIAKHLQASGRTREGDLIGTACYMAPEQAHGKASEVGPAGDIYSLGVILYEMLTGRVPLQGTSDLDTLLLVRTSEPVSPRRLQPGLPRDLETICLKCLRKAPSARYTSAEDLADDLGRFLAGEPVKARRTGMWERSVKWAKRRPAVAALLAVSAVAVLCLIVGGLVYNARLEAALHDAETKFREAKTAEEKAKLADQDRTEQLAVAHMREAMARTSGLMGQRFESLKILNQAVQEFRKVGRLDEKRMLDVRSVAIACLARPDLKLPPEWSKDPGWSAPFAFDPTLQYYVVHDDTSETGYVNKGNLSIRRLSDRQEVAYLPGFGVRVVAARFSPDGRYLAAHYELGKRHNYVWDLSTQKALVKDWDDRETFLAFTADSRRVAVPRADRSINIYDLPSGAKWKDVRPASRATAIQFHPDGRLAIACRESIQFIDLDGRPDLHISQTLQDLGLVGRTAFKHPGGIRALAFRNDGKVFATSCFDQPFDIYVWEVAKPEEPLQVLKGHAGCVISLAFSHVGDLLLSESWDCSDRLWDPLTGQQLSRAPVNAFRGEHTFGPNDDVLDEGWQVATRRECRTFHGAKIPVKVVISPAGPFKGRLMASLSEDGVQLWDLAARREGDKRLGLLPVGPSSGLAFDPSGETLITDSKVAGTQRWPIVSDAAGGFVVGPPQSPGLSAQAPALWGRSYDPAFALSTDGRTIAHTPRPGHLVLFELDNPSRKLLIESPSLRQPALSPDGRWLATGHWQGHGQGVRIWEAQTGKLVHDLDLGDQEARAAWVAYSPDPQAKLLLTATVAEYCMWETGSWRKMYTLPRENAGKSHAWIAFSPDGKVVAVLHSMSEVRLIEPATGRELARLPTSGWPYCFSPDGSQLITYGGEGGDLHVWDLRLIRRQLKEMDLDWELPATPPAEEEQHARGPLRVKVVPGEPPAPSDELRAQAHVERGLAYVQARKYSSAAKDFNNARALDPKRPPWNDAVNAYSQAIKLNPGDADAYHQRAHAQERLGQWRKAVTDHTRAIELAPQRVELHACRGRAHLGAGQKDRALEDYLKISAGKPKEADDIARYLLTSPSRLMRDPNLAMVMAKQATRDAPKEAAYWNTLGLAHYRLKELDAALKALAQAQKLAPGKHLSVNGFVLAMCHHQQGAPTKAKEAYDRALRVHQEELRPLSQTQQTQLNTLRAEAEALLKKPPP